MKYAYPFHIEGNDKDGMGFNVVFPDVYGANTGGSSYEEARSNVEDCLVCALGGYVQMGWDLPIPSPMAEYQELMAVPPMAAAKLSIYTAMRKQGISPSELASALKLSDAAIERLLLPYRHSPWSQVTRTLALLGCELVVEDKVA